MKAWAAVLVIILIMIVTLSNIIISPTSEATGPEKDSWSTFRGDSRHSGLSMYSTESNKGGLKWTSTQNGFWFHSESNSPTIDASDNLYATSQGPNGVYSFDFEGNERWFFDTGEDSSHGSSPAVSDDGTVYVGAGDSLFAINQNGTLKWKFLTMGLVYSSPVIDTDGTVYFGSEDCNLYAIYPNGTLKWNVLTSGQVGSSPAIDNGGIIYFIGCQDEDYHLFAYYPNGTIRWSYYIQFGYLIQSPAIDDVGTIYCYDDHETLYAIHPNGTLKWTYLIPHGGSDWSIILNPAIGRDGTIYSGSLDGLYALNPDGTLKWICNMRSSTYSPIISSDGTIYTTSGGTLWAIDSDGNKLWRFREFTEDYDNLWSQSIIGSDGTVYFTATSGLYAVNGEPTFLGITTSTWHVLFIISMLLFLFVILVRQRNRKNRMRREQNVPE